MGRHHLRREQLKHRERAKTSLQRDHQHEKDGDPGKPPGEATTQSCCCNGHHQQRDADDKGIKPMKPFQKHLEIHLSSWQKGPEAEGPVRTGKPCLHHPGCSTNHHQSDDSDNEMGSNATQTSINRRDGGSHQLLSLRTKPERA